MLNHLIEYEYELREERKIERLTKRAEFKVLASLGQIDIVPGRGIDNQLLKRLGTLKWVDSYENVLLSGPTGSGKTFIANALGQQACKMGKRVQYLLMNKLIRRYKESKLENSIGKMIKNLERMDILILDDIGLTPIDKETCRLLFEIIDDRYGNGSTIMSSQIPIKLRGKLFEDKTLGDAIIDRVIHNSFKIDLPGGDDSMRAIKKVVN